MKIRLTSLVFTVFALISVIGGCAPKVKKLPMDQPYVYMPEMITEDRLVYRYAPAFLIHGYHDEHNRIGGPEALYNRRKKEIIRVNPEKPVIFFEKRYFTINKKKYVNLVYRIHFSKVPFRIVPFYLTAGKNAGLLVIITLNSDKEPILVTNAGTCGCYAVSVPTTVLPQTIYPSSWDTKKPLNKYGEQLPRIINFKSKPTSRLLIPIRPDVHRVMDMLIVEDTAIKNSGRYRVIHTPLNHVFNLKQLPINGDITSFYHEDGFRKGYVKNAIKPWETAFLSWISFDLYVGTDKIYGDTRLTGNAFYTSLKPWNRNKSDMNDFAGYLRFWGWKL